MHLKNSIIKTLSVFLFGALLLQLISCGTLLYPERRGQTSGRIDPAIAILDGVGLIAFIIPGAIAFAVDFTTGAIYLPGNKKSASASSDTEDIMVVQVDSNQLNKALIEEIVKEKTGQSVKIDQENVKTFGLDGSKDIDKKLVSLSGQYN